MDARTLRMGLVGLGLALSLWPLLVSPVSSAAGDHRLSLTSAPDLPLASFVLRSRSPDHPLRESLDFESTADLPCDKDLDANGTISGLAFVAAQDNTICSNADIDVYDRDGSLYVVQAGGDEAAFTITRIGSDGTPTLVTQKIWVQSNTYTPDAKAFKQGTRSYIALSLERLAVGNAACGVVIVDVSDPANITNADLVQHIGSDWCDVHNSFVESDGNGDGKYLYLTADATDDMRVLDIGDLGNIAEVGRYTHPGAGGDNLVHDITVVDHGGSIGRRVYVSYWGAGLMILNAADVTPGVIETGSPAQPLNPDGSIDPEGFLTHHAFPSADGTRVFIQDEFLQTTGDEPVQMWDISSPATPAYVDGIPLGSTLMPLTNPAHNLLVEGNRLHVGWYKAGLQSFDFDDAGFLERALYHQVQTEPSDDSYDGAWGVRLASVAGDTYIFQSDRRYGLIVDVLIEPSSCPSAGGELVADADCDGLDDASDSCPDDPDCDGDAFSDFIEVFIGTDPLSSCGVASWPPDFNDDGVVTIVDVLVLKASFGSTDPDPGYEIRHDLNADGGITIADVLALKPIFGLSC